MKVILISDMHIGLQSEHEHNWRVDQLTRFLRSTICDEPLIIFILGDIIDHGQATNYALADSVFAHIKNELLGYDYQIYFIPGKEKVGAEMALSFLAYNMIRAVNLIGVPGILAHLCRKSDKKTANTGVI